MCVVSRHVWGHSVLIFFPCAVNQHKHLSLEDKFAPSFAKKPAIRQEEDGSRLMFECKIKSNPKPVVTWEHDGNTIHAVGRLKVSGVAGSLVMT